MEHLLIFELRRYLFFSIQSSKGCLWMIVTVNSLEEKGLHLLILVKFELLEFAILLHGDEGIE